MTLIRGGKNYIVCAITPGLVVCFPFISFFLHIVFRGTLGIFEQSTFFSCLFRWGRKRAFSSLYLEKHIFASHVRKKEICKLFFILSFMVCVLIRFSIHTNSGRGEKKRTFEIDIFSIIFCNIFFECKYYLSD